MRFDSSDDPTMVVEIWTILMVVFLLLFVMVLAAVANPSAKSSPNAIELARVVQGKPPPDELVLISDGSRLYTFEGRAVPLRTLAELVRPEHQGVALVVPENLTVARLDRLRAELSSLTDVPLRLGRLPEPWAARLASWTRGKPVGGHL